MSTVRFGRGEPRTLWLTAGILSLLYAGLVFAQLFAWWIEFGWQLTFPDDPLMIVGGLLAALAGVLILMRSTIGVPWLLLASLLLTEILSRGLSVTGWYWTWPWEFAASYDMNQEMFGSTFIFVWILRGTAPYLIIAATVLAFIALAVHDRSRPSAPPAEQPIDDV